MKMRNLVGAALLGLAYSFSAHAQAPTTSTPGVVLLPTTSASAGSGLPSAEPAGAVPANATVPMGTSDSGQMYPKGVPIRNINGGTQRADQPVSGDPAITGSQPTKRIGKGRSAKDRP